MELIDFYLNKKPTKNNYYFNEIMNWNNEKLEKVHNYIQYLFPLPDKSKYNPDAPVLDDQTLDEFLKNDNIRKNIIRAFIKICHFFGIIVVSYEPFGMEWNKKNIWITKNNHNFLRITRILKFLVLVNMKKLAYLLFLNLCDIHKTYPQIIDKKTWGFWCSPIQETLPSVPVVPSVDIKQSLINYGRNSKKIDASSELYKILENLWNKHGFVNNREMHIEFTKTGNVNDIYNNILEWKILDPKKYIKNSNNWLISKNILSLALPTPIYKNPNFNIIDLSVPIPPHITLSVKIAGGNIPNKRELQDILDRYVF